MGCGRPVLRTDFNADNQKLDAAITAARDTRPHVLLRAAALSSNPAQVDVDVSTLDLTQYYYLGLSPKAGAEYANAIMLRCNNLRGGYVDQDNTRDRTFFRFFMVR